MDPELDPKIKRGEQPKPRRKSIIDTRTSAQEKREKLYSGARRGASVSATIKRSSFDGPAPSFKLDADIDAQRADRLEDAKLDAQLGDGPCVSDPPPQPGFALGQDLGVDLPIMRIGSEAAPQRFLKPPHPC